MMSSGPQYPIGGRMADVVLGLARRFRLRPLMERHNSTLVMGAFALLNGFLSIALMALAAYVTRQPFIFPSLGPTAFLLFYTPLNASSAPRNTVLGHLIGVTMGYVALVLFGLVNAGPTTATGVSVARVGAAALSLGLTAGFMVWFKVPHPPAGATTLIVSLGILTKVNQMAVLMLAVVLLVVQGFVINRLAGLDYPIWAPHADPTQGPPAPSERRT
ncbi:MAG: HPP family protein [Herpetosiphonaceae bacterium]|nr:HPP family protein [Herpetosiphonaceae bacterium]